MVKVSEYAAEKLKELIGKQNKPEHTMLRVTFGGYGWGGPQLKLTLDELKGKNDVVVESQGITVVYESDLEGYLHNSVIDYSNSWLERGFVIRGNGLSSC